MRRNADKSNYFIRAKSDQRSHALTWGMARGVGDVRYRSWESQMPLAAERQRWHLHQVHGLERPSLVS